MLRALKYSIKEMAMLRMVFFGCDHRESEAINSSKGFTGIYLSGSFKIIYCIFNLQNETQMKARVNSVLAIHN